MEAPALGVRWISSEPLDGDWRVTWEVRNDGVDALKLDAAHAPHARFRGSERALGVELTPGATTRVELVVRAQPVDDAAPNPFLALRVTRADGPWLVLARLAITEHEGRPEAGATRISAQRRGFSRDTDAEADADAETRSGKAEGNDKKR
jgi:hypothetical protein